MARTTKAEIIIIITLDEEAEEAVDAVGVAGNGAPNLSLLPRLSPVG